MKSYFNSQTGAVISEDGFNLLSKGKNEWAPSDKEPTATVSETGDVTFIGYTEPVEIAEESVDTEVPAAEETPVVPMFANENPDFEVTGEETAESLKEKTDAADAVKGAEAPAQESAVAAETLPNTVDNEPPPPMSQSELVDQQPPVVEEHQAEQTAETTPEIFPVDPSEPPAA